MELQLYRNNVPTITIPIDEQTVYTHEVMGVHEVRCEFISPTVLDIKPDDYILFRNERYIINTEFRREKRSNFEHAYTIIFEGYVYLLKDIIFKYLGSIDFSYYGTARDFVQLVVDNMNIDDSGWAVGNIENTEEKNIEFYRDSEGMTCLAALTHIAEEFGLEARLTSKTIHLEKEAGVQTNLDFQYGRGKGLYSLTRGSLETPLYNRIYGYGANSNISPSYRNGAKRLIFNGGYIERALAVGERRRETSVIFDDIFPSRTGSITAVSADWLTLTDSSLDFDINDHLLEGETAKIVFKSGELSGYEYEISRYNHSSKTLTIIPFVEPDGYSTPNVTFNPSIGDQYTLVNIRMPQTYIDTAEAKLLEKTQDAFNQLARPPYHIVIDEKYMRDNGVLLNAGDRVRIKDADLDVDDLIRVTGVSFPLVNENQVTATISDSILYTQTIKQAIDTEKIKERVVVVDRTKAELARRNMLQTRRLQQLTFDPDGYFDTERIKPLSIETGMLSVGAKSQNFGLNGVTINANTNGDPNHLSISHGSLVHYEVEIEGLGFVWQMAAADFSGLDPNKSYYLSAKVRTTALDGIWYLSESPMKTDSEVGFWHFNVGVIYEVNDNVRNFDLTKGMTFIVGDQITTGTIKSLDGLSFFDLTQGTFRLGDSINGLDWGVTTPGALTINGFAIAKVVQVGSDGVINARISGITDELNPSKSIRFAAGVSDEFKVLDDGSMEATRGKIGNWVISNGGLVNDDGEAYIIARQYLPNNKVAAAMIGANVLSAITGLRAVGNFVNTEENGLTNNYGILLDVANGLRNISIKSNASIVGDAWIGSKTRYLFTPTSTNNTLDPSKGKDALVYIDNALLRDVYFPTSAVVSAAFGLGVNDDYSFVMSVTNHYSSVEAIRLIPPTGWIIKVRLGSSVTDATFLTIRAAESVTAMVIRTASSSWIQIISREATGQ